MIFSRPGSLLVDGFDEGAGLIWMLKCRLILHEIQCPPQVVGLERLQSTPEQKMSGIEARDLLWCAALSLLLICCRLRIVSQS